jgi:hypothetical protein
MTMKRARNDAGMLALLGGVGAVAHGLIWQERRVYEDAMREWRIAGRRNARRSPWRAPLAADGRRLAPWIYELHGKHGVYMIRAAGSGELLYIGESHTGRMKFTLTRHLWNWEGRGAGPTYDPRRVEIAVEVIDDPAEAVERQFELIRKLGPRDNVQDGHSLPPLEEVPF